MMESPGATHARFPSTHWSVLCRAGQPPKDASSRRASVEALARLYWKPVYAYFRLRWKQTREEAVDLTQDFFLWILEGAFTDHLDPQRGRFRAFVRACLDNFMRNQWRKANRQRRGGGEVTLSLDFGDDPDAFLHSRIPGARAEVPPEEILDHQWKRAIMEQAVQLLEAWARESGREVVYGAFARHDLAESDADRPSYDQVAQELGIKKSDVHNHLTLARRRLVDCVREVISESVDSEEALAEEMKIFFGS